LECAPALGVVGSSPANPDTADPTVEEPADVVTAPRSKRDECKPWRFNSALLRHLEGDRLVEEHRWKRCTARERWAGSNPAPSALVRPPGWRRARS
jgi:hypothetical protein